MFDYSFQKEFSVFLVVILNVYPSLLTMQFSDLPLLYFRCDLLDISPSLSEAARAIVDVSF